jgi:hypothetical protein
MTPNFKLIYLFLSISLISHYSEAQSTDINSQIKEEFVNPPIYAWPKVYWWWLNGNIDTVRIKEEILSMKNAGLSGFDIFEIGAPKSDLLIPIGKKAFMGDEFLDAVKIALNEASKYDMQMGLNLASSWNAGGAWITPEYASKSIYFSKSAYSGNGMKLSFPKLVGFKTEGKIQLEKDDNEIIVPRSENGKPIFYREISVIAVPKGIKEYQLTASQVIDVTLFFDQKNEILNWKTKGEYDIYRYVCSNSGEFLKIPSISSNGYIIDHLDSKATEFHFNYILKRLQTVLGKDISKSSLKSLYLASYEALGNVWTEKLAEKFEQQHGYSINKYISILFDKSMFTPETFKKVKRDLQFTISELMIDNFYRKSKEIANSHGLKINSEAGGPGFPLHNVPVEPLKALGVMDLPRGEFWINHSRLNKDGIDILRVVKEVSAASHIYGKGIVEEESFTSFQQWQESPAEMKPMGDRAFCEGMNKVVVHGSSHNPSDIGSPGIVYVAGTHFNDKNIWWPMIKPFNQYLARISNVFQKTDFKADVLYFYGSAVPNFTGHKNSRFTVGPGYDYEVTNTEILMRTKVENSELVLPTGSRFKVLSLENEEEIDPDVFSKIKELLEQGANIVGKKPKAFIDKKNSNNSKFTIKDIDATWVNKNTQKGKVSEGSAIEALQLMKIGPDFDYTDKDFNTLDFIHYEKASKDYYLVRNTTNQWVNRQCGFRVGDKTPEIWNPLTGEILNVNIFETKGDYTYFPVSMAPFASYLFAFSAKKGAAAMYNSLGNDPPAIEYTAHGTMLLQPGFVKIGNRPQVKNAIREQPLEGAWEVFFPQNNKTELKVIFPELNSWTDSENGEIKYFSGIAKYIKTFQMDINGSVGTKQRLYLDLGNISTIAEVWLNGQNLGITWTEPHRFDVTDVIMAGDNLLELKVANTWNNRLKGDAILGQKNTFTNILTTHINGLNKTGVPWKDVPLLKSGLFGPVKIVSLLPIN